MESSGQLLSSTNRHHAPCGAMNDDLGQHECLQYGKTLVLGKSSVGKKHVLKTTERSVGMAGSSKEF